jgi:hypothetical protein
MAARMGAKGSMSAAGKIIRTREIEKQKQCLRKAEGGLQTEQVHLARREPGCICMRDIHRSLEV